MGCSLFALLILYGYQTPRAEIEAVYRKFAVAWQKEDIAGLERLMHPTGFSISLDGSRWSFANARRDLGQMFATREHNKMRIVIDQVTFSGREAHVWLRSWQSFEAKRGKAWHRDSSRGWFFETVWRFPEGWRIVESQELHLAASPSG